MPTTHTPVPHVILTALTELEEAVHAAMLQPANPSAQRQYERKRTQLLSLIWAAIVDAEARGEERGGTDA